MLTPHAVKQCNTSQPEIRDQILSTVFIRLTYCKARDIGYAVVIDGVFMGW
jgi:hypothetical protein